MENRTHRIEDYYDSDSAWEMAERIVDLEDELAKILNTVRDTVVEANDIGGVDLNDLVARLEHVGITLPPEEDEDDCTAPKPRTHSKGLLHGN